jgi:hypothetical protein
VVFGAQNQPSMYLNLEDYYTHSGRYDSNPKFAAVIDILRSDQCRGRLHWGKAGWPRFAKKFDGSTEYGNSWCQFGCAVRAVRHPHLRVALVPHGGMRHP